MMERQGGMGLLHRHGARLACALLVPILLLVSATLAPAAWAGERQVDLQLVLAVDASGSIDARRFELQRRGYADAFADPGVLQAIRSGPLQSIAVTMFQ